MTVAITTETKVEEVCCRVTATKYEGNTWEYLVEAFATFGEGDRVGHGHAFLVPKHSHDVTFNWPEDLLDTADAKSEDLDNRAQALVSALWDHDRDELVVDCEGVDAVLFLYNFCVDDAYRGHRLSYRMMRMLTDLPQTSWTLAVLLPGPLPSHEDPKVPEHQTRAISALQAHWTHFGFHPLGDARIGDMRLYGHHLSLKWPQFSYASRTGWLDAS